MAMNNADIKSIDDYIALWPKQQQKILKEIRACIKTIVPEAEETISYQMPTYKLDGLLMHFAVFKEHYSLFPGPEPIEYFATDLKSYETSKGTIKIPMETAVPVQLIEKIVLHNLEKNRLKKSLSKKK
jgi:uncharacterized protein YdhG (YjbR/CyaY superfamily)